MKAEYSPPTLEVLGELHEVTSGNPLGLQGDFWGPFGSEDDTGSS